MYFLLVCGDLYGEKVNLEITFPTMPTIGELNRKVIETFNSEANLKRPQGYPAVEFSIARLQIYDDVLLKWTDLVACTQLHEYDQLYAFQPQSPWHIDVQKDLPPPRPPTNASRGAPAGYNNSSYDSFLGGAPAAQQSAVAASPYPTAGTPTQATYSVARNGGSPNTISRLDEQRRRELALQAELQRMHEETARLEAQAAAEAEEERRRQADDAERMLRQKEEEMRRQREALLRAEEEYRRLHEEAQFRNQGTSRFRN